MIEIDDATTESLIDFLALLVFYIRKDKDAAQSVGDHAARVMQELTTKWQAIPE